MPTVLTRNVTVNECPWLDSDLPEGTEVFIYYGYTYGCVTPAGKAVTLIGQDVLPFVEVPRNALGYIENEEGRLMAYKLGRLAARRPVGLADLKRYLHNPLPAAPESVAAPQLADWGILGNSTYGDCTIAGAAHLEMATALDNQQPVPMFTDTEVETVYFDLTGGQDTGLVEADVLQAWYTTGLFGSAEAPRRIAGYAPVDHRNQDELRSVVATFGGAYLGVAVPESAQEQFQAGQPWTVVPGSPIMGGHCVPAVGFSAEYLFVVTWAKLQPVAWSWIDAYCEEAFAVITPEDAVVNLAALQADLARLERAA